MEIFERIFFFVLIGVISLTLMVYFFFFIQMLSGDFFSKFRKTLLNDPSIWNSEDAVKFIKNYINSSDKNNSEGK